MKKRVLSFFAVIFVCTAMAAAQQIQSATAFFNDVSDKYASLHSYIVTLTVDSDGRQMTGRVYFMRQQNLLIEFSRPYGQVLLFDGTNLQIYLPGQETVLKQTVNTTKRDDENTSTKGLSLLRRYYQVAFDESSAPVPLEEGSSQMVVKLKLTRRSATEQFESIILAVDPNTKLMRRVIATTPQNKEYVFNFTNYSINAGISPEKWKWEPPASSNAYNNFLFQE